MDVSVSVEDKITLLMYLPEVGWITLICIPRAKLGELYLTPVKWLRYFASNAYGADGEIYSRGYTDEDADEDENMTDEDADKEEVMTDVKSEEEEEVPAVVKNHGESKEEPVLLKVPVDQTTILISAQLEEIPAICYFWSRIDSSQKRISTSLPSHVLTYPVNPTPRTITSYPNRHFLRGPARMMRRPPRRSSGSRRTEKRQSMRQSSSLRRDTQNSRSRARSRSTTSLSSYFSILSRGPWEWVREMAHAFPSLRCTRHSILAPHVHYGLRQTQQNTSGHMRTAPTSTSTSHSHRFVGQQQQQTNNVGTSS
ncbi:hypothetical protein B0H13DRAFT_2020899 [Mycena leptocephala]|nr:hypothetical protein B0H13DRAFT_2020899 [Mycena leptocephala]